MSKKYKIARIPIDAYEPFKVKNNVMNEIAREVGYRKRVSMADTFRYFGQKKTVIWYDEVKNFLNSKRYKNRGNRIV